MHRLGKLPVQPQCRGVFGGILFGVSQVVNNFFITLTYREPFRLQVREFCHLVAVDYSVRRVRLVKPPGKEPHELQVKIAAEAACLAKHGLLAHALGEDGFVKFLYALYGRVAHIDYIIQLPPCGTDDSVVATLCVAHVVHKAAVIPHSCHAMQVGIDIASYVATVFVFAIYAGHSVFRTVVVPYGIVGGQCVFWRFGKEIVA